MDNRELIKAGTRFALGMSAQGSTTFLSLGDIFLLNLSLPKVRFPVGNLMCSASARGSCLGVTQLWLGWQRGRTYYNTHFRRFYFSDPDRYPKRSQYAHVVAFVPMTVLPSPFSVRTTLSGASCFKTHQNINQKGRSSKKGLHWDHYIF